MRTNVRDDLAEQLQLLPAGLGSPQSIGPGRDHSGRRHRHAAYDLSGGGAFDRHFSAAILDMVSSNHTVDPHSNRPRTTIGSLFASSQEGYGAKVAHADDRVNSGR